MDYIGTFTNVQGESPYEKEDEYLKIEIDNIPSTYRLSNLITQIDTYTFSVWIKADSNCNVTLNILGTSIIESVTNDWKKVTKTVTVSNLNFPHIDITPDINSLTYYYEGYLVKGSIDTSWNPAPEDTEASLLSMSSNISKLEITSEGIHQIVESNYMTAGDTENLINESMTSVINQAAEMIQSAVTNNITGEGSYVNQKADKIIQAIGNSAFEPVRVKYVRDWLYGNDKDDQNRFMECKIINNEGINIAKGIIPSTYNESGNLITGVASISKYTDDITSEEDYIYNENLSMIQLTLSSVVEDVSMIQLFHYYADGRKNSMKLEISEDGTNWVTIYDSSLDGEYIETSEGHSFPMQTQPIYDQISYLKQTIDSFNLRVQQNEDKYAEISTQYDNITNRVQTVEDGMRNMTEEVIDANGWKVTLSSIGAYSDEENPIPETTTIRLNPDGFSVSSSEKKGRSTIITADRFSGFYNDGISTYEDEKGEEVFFLDEDLLTTARVKIKRGADFITMKQIPVTFNNVKGIVFVKAGGDV